MPRASRSVFEVSMSEEERRALTDWLATEIVQADAARASLYPSIEYWHTLYEQGRTRMASKAPWEDAADLTSPLATMYVDALHARAMRTIFTEPVCIVEGWGAAADRAPYVEAFHEWKQEEERLQTYVDKAIHRSWIEPAGILEVLEETDVRWVRRTMQAKVQVNDVGGLIFDEQGRPQLATGPDGRYVESLSEQEPSARVQIDSPDPIRIGPGYQVIPYRDFLILPGHARDQKEVWGYAKRFWRRVPDLAKKAGLKFEAGSGQFSRVQGVEPVYDAEAVEQLGSEGERQLSDTMPGWRAGLDVAYQTGVTAEKELHEVLFLRDLDGRGERWYVATLHVTKRLLLRLQHDDLGQSRYVRFTPFPRSDSLDGYSLVGHKLITGIEEHTAYRNMAADRAALTSNAPMKRLDGALWDPSEQPLGAGMTITVRDMNEVQPMVIPDLSAPALNQIRFVEAMTERVIGINDITLGAQPERDRTLGENQLVANYSEVRIDTILKRLQESIEQLYQIRHAIWKRALAEQPDGVELPQSALIGLETKQSPIAPADGKITAALLEGQFRFKPRGSVETADLGRQLQGFVQFMSVVPRMVQVFPALAGYLQRPEAARAIWEQAIRLFKMPDRQAFLGGEQAPVLQPPQMAPPGPGQAPGAPPGLVPPAAQPAGAPGPSGMLLSGLLGAPR